MSILFYDRNNLPKQDFPLHISTFLHTHLEQFGDPPYQIEKAILYALDSSDNKGGFAAVARSENEIIGAVVINRTGMEEYIPENILVYIAIHRDYRGQGLGGRLMEACMERAEGDIALHVEPNNPALFLYKKLGFTNKYLEMRFIKKEADNGLYNT